MKPKFTKTINYLLNDEKGFKTFIKDSRIPLRNNRCESNFRPWCHKDLEVSFIKADAAAKNYSLMMTAKINGYNVYAYFSYLFDKI